MPYLILVFSTNRYLRDEENDLEKILGNVPAKAFVRERISRATQTESSLPMQTARDACAAVKKRPVKKRPVKHRQKTMVALNSRVLAKRSAAR